MRGIEGKIEAIRYARTRNIPYFGICLGMQCAVVEFARSELGLQDANSTEFDQTTEHPVICDDGGATSRSRTGRHDAAGCLALRAGPRQPGPPGIPAPISIHERHRHRYELEQPLPQGLPGARAWSPPGPAPTARSSRSWSGAIIPGSWPSSSTPNSSPSRPRPIRCSATSSPPRCDDERPAASARAEERRAEAGRRTEFFAERLNTEH